MPPQELTRLEGSQLKRSRPRERQRESERERRETAERAIESERAAGSVKIKSENGNLTQKITKRLSEIESCW